MLVARAFDARAPRVGDKHAIGVNDPAKKGSIQGEGRIQVLSDQGDLVGRPRHEVDGEPVLVTCRIDVTRDGAADCDAA